MVTSTAESGARQRYAEPASRRWSRWWLNRSVRAKGLTVLAVPLTVLTAVICTGLTLQLRERAERQAGIAANNLIRTAQAVVADAIDAETGARGYGATANRLFLDEYTAAVARLDTDLSALRHAAPGHVERRQADAVTHSAVSEFAMLARILTKIDAGTSGAGLITDLRSDKTQMDRLRSQVATMIDAPTNLLAQKRLAITRLESNITTVSLIGLALGLLAGLVGVGLFSSGISRRVKVTADNAERLGRGEPLHPTPASRDELGRLSDAHARAERVLTARLADLSAARDEALLATRAKNVFLSRTSHELRTPLNAILGFSQLLEMADLCAEDRDSTMRILSAGRHLLVLINEVIDIARVESGELGLSVEPVRMDDLISDVVALLGPLAAARAITVEQEPGDASLAVFADHQRLRQVLINLGSNAVKYNHHGGMIRIGAKTHDGDTVDLTVSDTGPGLTGEEMSGIFVPFERLDAAERGIEGTGIGLPLALALTEAMHGHLSVTSNRGQGSVFTVRLPQAPAVASNLDTVPLLPPVTVLPVNSDTTAQRPLVVLSIEDNIANSEVLARLFRTWPHTTLHAALSGHAGLDLASRHHPDVILLDLHLPDLPGEEVLARLRADPATADIPVAVLSADASPATIRRLHSSGIVSYLTKPLDLRELATLLNDLSPQGGNPDRSVTTTKRTARR
jgi:signal transduction histidine kinase/CheY-like chemotaxis protein